MSIKYLAGGIVAAGDTVKTSLGTLTLPAGTTEIIGAWCHAVGGPGSTTLEHVTGIFELESPDMSLQPCQIPLESFTITGTGAAVVPTKVWPLNMPVRVGSKVTGYVTLDMAITLANTCRFGLVVNVAN